MDFRFAAGVAEYSRGAGEGQAGLGGNQDWFGGGGGERSGDYGGGGRVERRFQILRVFYEDHAVAGGGGRNGGGRYGDGAVSDNVAAEFLGQIVQGLLHGCLLSLYGAGVYNAGMIWSSLR